MPEFYCNPGHPAGVKLPVAPGSQPGFYVHLLFLRPMFFLFLALVAATALLAMDTARRVRNMVSPVAAR